MPKIRKIPKEVTDLVLRRMPIADQVRQLVTRDKNIIDTYILTYVKMFRKLLEMIHNVTMIKYYVRKLDKKHKMDTTFSRLPDNSIKIIISEYNGNDKFLIKLEPFVADEEEPLVHMDVTDLSTNDHFTCELGTIHAITRRYHSRRIDDFTIKNYIKSVPDVIKFLVAFSRYQPEGEHDDTINDVNELADVDRAFFLKYKDDFNEVSRPTMFIDWKENNRLHDEVRFAFFIRKLLHLKPDFRVVPPSKDNQAYFKLIKHYISQLTP
jgi:hypothetical protein